MIFALAFNLVLIVAPDRYELTVHYILVNIVSVVVNRHTMINVAWCTPWKSNFC